MFKRLFLSKAEKLENSLETSGTNLLKPDIYNTHLVFHKTLRGAVRALIKSSPRYILYLPSLFFAEYTHLLLSHSL